MIFKRILALLKDGNKVLLLAVLLFGGYSSYGQACDCPAVGSCGPCQGGLINLELDYTGGVVVSVTASDDSGPVGATFLSSEILVESATPGVPFDGDVTVNVTYLSLPLNLVDSETFNTSCSPPLYEGTIQGNFVVLGGESLSGGTICCEPSEIETVPPVITGCPSDIDVALASGCSMVVNWTAPMATDDCNLASFVSTHDPGDTFSAGTTVVTYTATDDYGNEAICTFNVNVTEDIDPIISGCPSDFIFFADASCGQVVNWTPPSASDNCTMPIVPVGTHNSGETFGVGTTVVTYTATDDSGNEATCSFNVTIMDNSDPVFVDCPIDITVSANASCEAIVNWTVPTVNDNCTSITPTGTHDPGDTFGLGTTQVTYLATDASGNSELCSFIVTVNDDTAPIISGCPTDITVSADGACEAIVNWTPPTATDNCAGTVTPTSAHTPGDTFGIGVTLVTYDVSDGRGNSSSCTFNVTVVDDTPPVFSGCPTDITVSANASCEAVVNWTAPTATDNCSGSVTPTSPINSGDTFSLGSTLVTYTATDGAGNMSVCTFNVIVNDDTDPVFSGCLTDITVSANGSCEAIVNWTPPTATDNCDAITPTSPFNPGDTFTLGTTLVTYTAEDAAGNTATCSFNVIVSDDTDPMFSACPSDITISANASCESIVNWTAPTATDNCSGSVTPTTSHNPGDTFGLGVTLVTYSAEDAAGNTATCTFNVTVNDDTDPVFAGCPVDIIVSANASCQSVVNWSPPTVGDNCSGSIVPTSSHNPGDTFGLGTTLVTYIAEDAAGNTTACSFNVIVNDDTDPVFSNCPGDITVSSVSSCQAVVTWTAPSINDNCTAGITPTSTHNSGDSFGIGTTLVTYTATDGAGNTTTCSFNVNVNDTTDPVFTNCPPDIVVAVDGTCQATVSWTPPTASDNCNISVTNSSHASGDSFGLGSTLVTYTTEDVSGNTATCSFSVIVNDTSDPVITSCPSDITVSANATCQEVVNWAVPTATDNCDVSITAVGSHNPGDEFGLGVTTVTYTATDAAGNSSMCSFNVTVDDSTPPVISGCPSDMGVSANPSCEAVVSWQAPSVDDCSEVTLTSNFNSGDTFPFGTTEVVYTATDNDGLSSTCSFNVTVIDETRPDITNCPVDIAMTANTSCEAVATWAEPDISDNCGSSTLTANFNSGEVFPVGITEIVYTATDANGNQSICKFNVIVSNENEPVIAGCPENIMVEAGESGTIEVQWQEPSATAACGSVTLRSTHEPGATFSVGDTEVIYTATDDLGVEVICSFNVTVAFEEVRFDIVPVVTPNNDGQNDVWKLPNIERYSNNTVTIVDRWGSEIYSATGYDNDQVVWDGTNLSGTPVPTGTYFYYISVDFVSSTVEKSGFIELIR